MEGRVNMSKIKTFIKDNYGYILSFLIPFIILYLIYYLRGITIGGDSGAGISDMYAQYIPLFTYLKEALSGNVSASYSFYNGLGSGMMSTWAYYLISPFNLLVVFFKEANIDQAILLISTLKLSLASLTAFIFFKHHFPKLKPLELVIFSLCYSLAAYNVAMYFHVMWFDAYYALPLIALGIDKIVKGNKPWLYGLFLAYAIICNYFMGYMLCLFSVLYFIYALCLEYRASNKTKIVKAIITFGVTSLCFGLMTFFIMWPMLKAMQGTNRFTSEALNGGIWFHNLLNLIGAINIGSNTATEILAQTYNLPYCGIIVLPLLVLYFLNKKISKKEKIVTGLLCLFLFLSLWNNYLFYLWNAFIIPSSFTFRFTFIINFLLIMIALKAYSQVKYNTKTDFLIAALVLPSLELVLILADFALLDLWYMYVTVALSFIYITLLSLKDHLDDYDNKRIKHLIIFLVMAELFFNAYTTINSYTYVSKKYEADVATIYKTQFTNLDDDESFARMESGIDITSLDSFRYQYHGVTNFISTINEKVLNFSHKVGYTKFSNAMYYDYSNLPIVSSLLGVKYIIGSYTNNAYEVIDTYELSAFNNEFYNLFKNTYYISRNNNATSLIYAVSKEALTNLDDELLPMVYQDYILASMTDYSDSTLTAVDVINDGPNQFHIEVASDQDLYLGLSWSAKENDEIKIYVDDKAYTVASRQKNENYLYLANHYQIGDIINIRIETNQPLEDAYLYGAYFDQSLYENKIQILQNNSATITDFSDTDIKATININDDYPVLFTSIPNEEGWTLYVDGTETPIITLYDAFIGAELTPGEHEIELVYKTPGILVGAIISLVALGLFLIYNYYHKVINQALTNLFLKYEEIFWYLVMGVLTTLVNLLTYALFRSLLDYRINTVIAWIVSVSFAYITNKKWVFKSKQLNRQALFKEIYDFFKYRLVTLLLELLMMYVLVSLLTVNDMVSKIIANIIVIIANYLFSKVLVFKKKARK